MFLSRYLGRIRPIITNSRLIGRPLNTSTFLVDAAPKLKPVTIPIPAGSLPSSSNAVSNWLFACSGLVFGMVVLGGVTRLTKSGLSMVEWKIQGGLPPMSPESWLAEFEKYKQFPEYKKARHDMTLDEFKSIYYYEWAHRMLGRVIGITFAVPFAWFAWRRALSRTLTLKLSGLLAFGGLQGLIGWWMVKSGLEEQPVEFGEPRVSPYRLATHLITAFALYGGLIHTAIGERRSWNPVLVPKRVRSAAMWVVHLAVATAMSGAFVAGNRAGLVYNEWPFMGNGFIPDDVSLPHLTESPWRNCFENVSLVQFEHRTLAYATLLSTGLLYMVARRPGVPTLARRGANIVTGTALTQASLGVATLLTYVPVELAAMHQAGSLALLTTTIWLLRNIRTK